MTLTDAKALRLLNIEPPLDVEMLQKAFRRKALECHPDKLRCSAGVQNLSQQAATQKFQEVLEAFTYLKNNFTDEKCTLFLLKNSTQDTEHSTCLKLSQTEKLDKDLYCFVCRCGYDVPIALDTLSKYEVNPCLESANRSCPAAAGQPKNICASVCKKSITAPLHLEAGGCPKVNLSMKDNSLQTGLKKKNCSMERVKPKKKRKQFSPSSVMYSESPVKATQISPPDASASGGRESSLVPQHQDSPCCKETDQAMNSGDSNASCGGSNVTEGVAQPSTPQATVPKGIVYLSRVPPFMNPTKLRQYFQNFGTVERIYLTPESAVQRKNRLRVGGSKKEMFREGWVEFHDKKIAKFVGHHLNNTPVGGPKRHNFWRDDIWNLRYLPKFQWHHLLEYHTGKKKAREAKRTAELLQVRRENVYYLDQVEKKRKYDTIAADREKRKLKKLQKAEQSPQENHQVLPLSS